MTQDTSGSLPNVTSGAGSGLISSGIGSEDPTFTSWTGVATGLTSGAGGFNPFVNADLGWQFVLSNLLTNTAAVLTWQTCIARLLAAKDTKTGRKVYTGTAFFFICRWVIPGIWGIAALATLT